MGIKHCRRPTAVHDKGIGGDGIGGLGNGTARGHGQCPCHVGAVEDNAIDVGNVGVSGRDNTDRAKITSRVSIKHDGVGTRRQCCQTGHSPGSTVGNTVILHHRHILSRQAQVTQLVSGLGEQDVAALCIECDRRSRQDPGRCLSNVVILGNRHRRGRCIDGDIAQHIGKVIENNPIAARVNAGRAGGLPTGRTIGNGTVLGDADGGPLQIEIAQTIVSIGQRNIAATDCVPGNVVGMKCGCACGPGTRCTTISDRITPGGLLGVEGDTGDTGSTTNQL